MQAYGKVLGEDGTTMILSPDSEFLSFLTTLKVLDKMKIVRKMFRFHISSFFSSYFS